MAVSHEESKDYTDGWGQGEVCAGGGSDPPLRGSRVGFAALVAPTPGTSTYPENIEHGYFKHLRWIQIGSFQHRPLIHIAAGTDTDFIDRRYS